ncbi:hypothetical protein G9A89_001723 [Geosiphon pyriformis]|nr:hypothetical protein G9A89_001723 [Geosiphon pyriformis]
MDDSKLFESSNFSFNLTLSDPTLEEVISDPLQISKSEHIPNSEEFQSHASSISQPYSESNKEQADFSIGQWLELKLTNGILSEKSEEIILTNDQNGNSELGEDPNLATAQNAKQIFVDDTIEAIAAEIIKRNIDISGLNPDQSFQKLGGFVIGSESKHAEFRYKRGDRKLSQLQRTTLLRALKKVKEFQKSNHEKKLEVLDSKPKSGSMFFGKPDYVPSRVVSAPQASDSLTYHPTTVLFLSFKNPIFINIRDELVNRLKEMKMEALFHNCPDHQENQLDKVTEFVFTCAVSSWARKMKFCVVVTQDETYSTSVLISFLGRMRVLGDKDTIEIFIARFGVYELAKKDIISRCNWANANGVIFSKSLEPSQDEIFYELISYLTEVASDHHSIDRDLLIELCNQAEGDHQYHQFCNCYFAAMMIDQKIWFSVEHYVQAHNFDDEEIRNEIRKAPNANYVFAIAEKNAESKHADLDCLASLSISPTDKSYSSNTSTYNLMRKAIYNKFTQHPKLKHKLLATAAKNLKFGIINQPTATTFGKSKFVKYPPMDYSQMASIEEILLETRFMILHNKEHHGIQSSEDF